MASDLYVPIKVVLPIQPFDYKKDPSQGGSNKMFCEVTPTLRKELAGTVTKIEAALSKDFESHPTIPGVVSVSLRPEAIAISPAGRAVQ